ncbi:hypothetical protein TNCV_3882321 [Trichonephila clavipes]|nr:hypothetical protein TNCV_3882321 [Trichonephila clavipes]
MILLTRQLDYEVFSKIVLDNEISGTVVVLKGSMIAGPYSLAFYHISTNPHTSLLDLYLVILKTKYNSVTTFIQRNEQSYSQEYKFASRATGKSSKIFDNNLLSLCDS